MHDAQTTPLIGITDPLKTRGEAIASALASGGFGVIQLDPRGGAGPDGLAAIVVGTEDDADALAAARQLEARFPGIPIFVLPNSVGDTPPSRGHIHGIAPATSLDTFLAQLRQALSPG